MATADVVVSLGCDLKDLPAPRGTLVRWDDVPAPSADFDRAAEKIRERVMELVDELVRKQQRKPTDDGLRTTDNGLPDQRPADTQAARHTFGNRSIEAGIVQRAQERDEIALATAAHVQPARQRIDLIAADLGD